MTPRVLVAGIGNIFLGDDGFGPEVVRRLAGDELPADVGVVDYGIRGLHLAYDLLDGYAGLVLVDAVPGQAVPGSLRVLEVGSENLGQADVGGGGPNGSGPSGDDVDGGGLGGGGLDAHSMDPVTVLASVRALGGRLPRTFVVGCVPACLDEGIGLSLAVAAAVEPAAATVRALLADELTATPAGAARTERR